MDFEDRIRREGMNCYESPSGSTGVAYHPAAQWNDCAETARERILEDFGAEKVDDLSRMYAEAYEGSNLTAEEIWEEIICDSLADMNIFAKGEKAASVAEALADTKKAVAEAEHEQNRGPPRGKMSRENNKEGTKYDRAGEGIRYDTEYAESSGRVGKHDPRGARSRASRYAGKIKEILRQTVQPGNIYGNRRGQLIKKETANDFEARTHEAGMRYFELGNDRAIAFVPAAQFNENARIAQEQLVNLGIDVIIYEGELQVNRGSQTERSEDAASFNLMGSPTVFISADLNIDGLETAYHEGFHIAKLTHDPQIREDMMNIVANAVNVESSAFTEFIHEIADMYGLNENSVKQEWFHKNVTEEAYAWYIGSAYSNDGGYMLQLMRRFSDVPETKAKLDEVFTRMPEARAEQPDSGLTSRETAAFSAADAQMVSEIQKGVRSAVRENQKARELRSKIIRHANDMSQKLLRPSDKRHIPEELRGTVAALLERINRESGYEMALDKKGKRRRVEPGSALDAEITKRTKAFRELKSKYRDILDNTEIVVDPSLLGNEEVQGYFDKVLEMGDIPLMDMNSEQLETVWCVLRAVEHSVTTAGKVLSQAKYKRTQEWADALVKDTSTRRKRKGSALEKLSIDLENPYTFFSHYGESGKAIFRMLRDTQDAQQEMVEQVRDEVAEIVDPKTVHKWEREVHEFTTERGEKLTLTTAQCMEIYELMKREHAHDHLMKGGIVQPEIKHKKIQRGTDAILLTQDDLTVDQQSAKR